MSHLTLLLFESESGFEEEEEEEKKAKHTLKVITYIFKYMYARYIKLKVDKVNHFLWPLSKNKSTLTVFV